MINFPTEQWLDAYVERHNATLEEAEMAWWDKEIDKGNQTPFDLTEDQLKEAKAQRKNAKSENAVNAYGKPVKRERKANADKREIISTIATNLTRICGENLEAPQNIEIVNVEKQIDFLYNGVSYSVTLTAHRPKK